MRSKLQISGAAMPAHASVVAAATKAAEASAQKSRPERRTQKWRASVQATGPPLPFDRPAFMEIPTWCAFSGMSRTGVYEAAAFGHLRTIKCGRKRLVDVEQGLAWLHSLATTEAA